LNDIWYLGGGLWMVYVEDLPVVDDFKSIPDLQLITAYYDLRGSHRATQFRFFQGTDLRPGFCLLHYVSRLAGFDYYKVLDLAKRIPGSSYAEIYQQSSYQPELLELFNTYEPIRKPLSSPRNKKKCKAK